MTEQHDRETCSNDGCCCCCCCCCLRSNYTTAAARMDRRQTRWHSWSSNRAEGQKHCISSDAERQCQVNSNSRAAVAAAKKIQQGGRPHRQQHGQYSSSRGTKESTSSCSTVEVVYNITHVVYTAAQHLTRKKKLPAPAGLVSDTGRNMCKPACHPRHNTAPTMSTTTTVATGDTVASFNSIQCFGGPCPRQTNNASYLQTTNLISDDTDNTQLWRFLYRIKHRGHRDEAGGREDRKPLLRSVFKKRRLLLIMIVWLVKQSGKLSLRMCNFVLLQ